MRCSPSLSPPPTDHARVTSMQDGLTHDLKALALYPVLLSHVLQALHPVLLTHDLKALG